MIRVAIMCVNPGATNTVDKEFEFDGQVYYSTIRELKLLLRVFSFARKFT